jgi:hypothetical protein
MAYEYLSKQSSSTVNKTDSSPSTVEFQDNRTSQLKIKQLAEGIRSPLQRVDLEEEEDVSQAKAIHPVQREKNTTGLPDNLKSGMEQVSGMSLDHVNVHYNSSKPSAVQAHAYAQGSDIHVAPGQEQHIPHELGHVVQQAQGRVQPTTSVNGMQVNDNPALEIEATKMGEAAMQRAVNTSTSLGSQQKKSPE